MNTYEKALELLPRRLLTESSCIPASEAEEFRLRTGRKAAVLIGGTEIPISDFLTETRDIDWVIEECGIGFVRTCQHCHRLMDEGWWCGETWTFCSKECMLAENRGMSEAEMEERMENGDIEWMEWKMGGKRR